MLRLFKTWHKNKTEYFLTMPQVFGLKKCYFQFSIILIFIFNINLHVHGQVGFGTKQPHPSAAVDFFSNNKGLLIPRISLKDTEDVETIAGPANTLIIFNTNTAGSVPLNVAPGYYYFNAQKRIWIRINDGNNWGFQGNAGLNSKKHFLGTNDNKDLLFKVKKQFAGWINQSSGITAYGFNSYNPSSHGEQNTSIGYESLYQNTSGSFNTSFGFGVLSKNTTGNSNVAVGTTTLVDNETGSFNVAFGGSNLRSNIAGNGNVANGSAALFLNNSGSYNVALGFSALYNNNSGNYNSTAGYYALYGNVSGSDNIAFGPASAPLNKANENVAFGFTSLASNETGKGNLVYGRASLANNLGSANSVLGAEAMARKVVGDNSSAIGAGAAVNFWIGENNTFIGHNSYLPLDTIKNVSREGNDFLNIGNLVFGLKVNSSDPKIGIRMELPTSTLDVNGSISFNQESREEGEVISETDFTVLVHGNVSLPTANDSNKGRIYTLVNDNATNNYILQVQANGKLRDNGDEISFISFGSSLSGMTVQSTGLVWQILSKY